MLVSFPMVEVVPSARMTMLSWALVSLPISSRLSGEARRMVFEATKLCSPIHTSPKISTSGDT